MSLSRHALTALVLIPLLVLGACGRVPQPFRPTSQAEKAQNPLLAQADGVGVIVAPVIGLDPARGLQFSEALIVAFRRGNIPATTGNRLSRGHLLSTDMNWSEGQARLFWMLEDAKGELLGEDRIEIEASNLAWRRADPQLMEALAREAATQVARLLKPDVMAAGGFTPTAVAVAILGVEGAPGDGRISLPAALRVLFKDAKLPVVADPASAGLLIRAEVEPGVPADGMQPVTLVWRFSRNSGEEIAVIRQENLVPVGQLNSNWGDLAFDIAYALTGSVADMLALVENLEAEERFQNPG